MKRFCLLGILCAVFPLAAMGEDGLISKLKERANELLTGLSGESGNAIQSLEALAALIVLLIGGILAVSRWAKPRPLDPEGAEPLLSRDLAEPYYAALADQCDELPLRNVLPELGQRDHGLSLSRIYQDQRIRLAERDPAGHGRFVEGKEPLPLMQALAKVQEGRWVVRGRVGTGKSSFVNYLAHCIVRSRKEAVPDLPAAMANRPVARLLLREAGTRLPAGADRPEPGFIWDEIEAAVERFITVELARCSQPPLRTGEFQRFWNGEAGFQRQFERRGVLLLDGLDEVSETENRRELLRQAIAEFSRQAPGAFILVTGRPYSYQADDQKLAGFPPASDLEPMTEPQIREFIRQWFLAAPRPDDGDPAQPEERARRLADDIFARGLKDMADTPMLLTLFIGLDYCGKHLPSSRAKLYEEAIDLLLQRWHENLRAYKKSLGEAERHGLEILDRSREDILKALQKLAYTTYLDIERLGGGKDEALAFSEEAVLGHLCKALPNERDHQKILYFLQYRSALLVAGRGNDFEFPHKSFHEYLAASHLVGESNWKDKVKELLRANLEWWREVFLLLVKKYSDTAFGDAVLFLHHGLPAAESGSDAAHRQRLLLLAATAGVELAVRGRAREREDARDFHRFLQTALVDVLPSAELPVAERAEAGRLLAEVGDPRPGVTVKKAGGQPLRRRRGQREHDLPDIDWVEIPAGSFTMGTEGDEGYDDEKPAHDITLPRFFISRAPVTNAQYRCFIDAGGYEDLAFWHRKLPVAAGRWLEKEPADEALLETIADEALRENYRNWLKDDTDRKEPRFWRDRQWTPDNHPVVGVSWFEALAYAAWLEKLRKENPELGPPGAEGLVPRLPTEAEWEYAARGPGGLCYAWGDEADPKRGNYADTGLRRTSAVGLFPPGRAFGLDDMSGNVWEWTLSRWGREFGQPDFTYETWQEQEPERNLPEPVEFRIIRGGSWDNVTGLVRCAVRGGNPPDARFNFLGFRLVVAGVLPGPDS